MKKKLYTAPAFCVTQLDMEEVCCLSGSTEDIDSLDDLFALNGESVIKLDNLC